MIADSFYDFDNRICTLQLKYPRFKYGRANTKKRKINL